MNIKHCNLNDKIKVKLTHAGREYLKRKNYQLTTDNKGYLILSLWEFAGIFGEALQLPTLNPPVESGIVLFTANPDPLTDCEIS